MTRCASSNIISRRAKKSRCIRIPAGVVYVLSGATLKFSYPDGRTEEKTAATGQIIWRDPVTHAVENTGKTEARAIAIDLKK
jgi:hypothetical protein